MPEKYDRLGHGYNATRRADPYLVQRLCHHLRLAPGQAYLDIGCGTGNYTHALHQAGGRMTGVDPSVAMLDQARARYPELTWRQGAAEAIPLPGASVAGATGVLTLHHWPDLPLGMRELYRVLQPGARLVFFTSTPAQMAGYWLQHYFPRMLQDSQAQMPRLEVVVEAFSAAGFRRIHTEDYAVAPDLQDGFLYVGKHDPTRYLDPDLRRGISSFADLARAREVEDGLAALAEDIASGKVREVMTRYRHAGGDYCFVVAQR